MDGWRRRGIAALAALAMPACAAAGQGRGGDERPAEVRTDEAAGSWTLASGDAEYVLRRRQESVVLEYFGPAGLRGKSWDAPDVGGRAGGEGLSPADLVLVGHEVRPARDGMVELALRFHHRHLPLEVHVRTAAWGQTGVFTRQVTLTNTGDRELEVEWLPSLALRLPPGPFDLTYLHGGWGRERQVATERLAAGRRAFVSNTGRSTSRFSPWFALRHGKAGATYAAQLAWSGNWQMHFERQPGARALEAEPLQVEMGLRFDFGGPLLLPPGGTFASPPAAFTAAAGDVDDAANRLHRYQRRYVAARTPANDPPLVQFNSWYPFQGRVKAEDMKRCADAAADLGAEVFVLDAGWFNRKSWEREIGDWQTDPAAFPNGLGELAGHVHGLGMKFGIWVEIENLGVDSKMGRERPAWCLQFRRKPVLAGARYPLDFANPDVRRWARGVVDRLAKECALDWIKIDYNADIGESFETAGGDRPGDLLIGHLRGYYAWLDELRAAYPKLVIENCSSGGLRFDLGSLARTHTTWISDEVGPIPSLQLAYGSTLEFLPEACNHWMVGDRGNGTVVATNPPGWWDFMFRVPMNGQFGISSKVFQWTPEIRERAKAAVAAYKRIRGVLRGADAYHLTPCPAHEKPTGWMAIQYISEDRARGVLLAYRLAEGAEREVFRLRGLDPGRTYRLAVEGKEAGRRTGKSLAEEGLPVALDAEWRAAVVEMAAD